MHSQEWPAAAGGGEERGRAGSAGSAGGGEPAGSACGGPAGSAGRGRQRGLKRPVASDGGGEQRRVALVVDVGALGRDLERQNLGLTGDWSNWDVKEFHHLEQEAPEAAPFARETLIPNKRHEQLGRAFQNDSEPAGASPEGCSSAGGRSHGEG